MTDHKVIGREEWQAARDELLQREKEHTRMGDELARQRRELPWVVIEKEYLFDTDEGTRTLAGPDGLLPDPRPGAEGARRGRRVADLDPPP
jgi:predicted dithiol-disulfide oxidoreductase (DUF899 family)